MKVASRQKLARRNIEIKASRDGRVADYAPVSLA